MESYIVRVYRRDKKDPEEIVGLVEVVETGEVKKFANRYELDQIVSTRGKASKRSSKGRSRVGGPSK